MTTPLNLYQLLLSVVSDYYELLWHTTTGWVFADETGGVQIIGGTRTAVGMRGIGVKVNDNCNGKV